MQSVNNIKLYLIYKYSCKGTGYIPSHYKPCPWCHGHGKGILKDCRLCDDLCYVTEPWVQCQVCYGKGKQGNLGALSQDSHARNGVGFTKPGMGVNTHINPGMPVYWYWNNYPGMAGPGYNPGYMPGMAPTIPPSIPPAGYGPHGYGPHYGYPPRY